MSKLPLALDIADTVVDLLNQDEPVDLGAAAERLALAHPEAETKSTQVEEVLADELHELHQR
jgi:hypothetical protein